MRLLLIILAVAATSPKVDIRGYPRDRCPDAGCYEFNYDTCAEDMTKKVFPYIDVADPNNNYWGDFNSDRVVDANDYETLADWWATQGPVLILPYPEYQYFRNTPTTKICHIHRIGVKWDCRSLATKDNYIYDPNELSLCRRCSRHFRVIDKNPITAYKKGGA